MNIIRTTLTLALLGLTLGAAHAQSGTTRSEVRNELAQAQASGAVEVVGDSGLLLRERFPLRYGSAAPSAPASTRDDVRLTLQDAIRVGALPHGDLDRTDREIARAADTHDASAMGKTREQVRTELAQARRLGDIEEAGDGGRLLRDIAPGRYQDERGPAASRTYALAASLTLAIADGFDAARA